MYFIYQVIICFIYYFCHLISFSSLQSRDDFIHTLLTSLGHIFLVFFLVLFEFFILILLRTFFLTLLSEIFFFIKICHCCWYYSHSLHWYLWLLSTIYAFFWFLSLLLVLKLILILLSFTIFEFFSFYFDTFYHCCYNYLKYCIKIMTVTIVEILIIRCPRLFLS